MTTTVTASAPTATAVPTGIAVPLRTVVPGSGASRRIGLIGPSSSDPFARAVTDSVATQLAIAGAKLIRCDPGVDATLVLDCARRLATQRVDGWIVVQAGNLGQALCAAGPAGIPLITVGAAPLPCQTGWVGADNRRAGDLVGTALGRAAQGRPHPATAVHCARVVLIILTNPADEPVSAARVAGIRAGFADQCPDTATQPTVLQAGTTDLAYNALQNALDGLPADAGVLVASVDDAAALGAAAAVPAGRSGEVTIAAVGGNPRARCEIRTDPHWLGDAALFPDRYGQVVVPAMLDALVHRPVPPAMDVTARFLTAGTLPAAYPNDHCPAQ